MRSLAGLRLVCIAIALMADGYAVARSSDTADAPEIYRYVCKNGGRTSVITVDESNNKLTWSGRSYKITHVEDCGRYGWRAERGDTSFNFCTATKGYASFDLPTGKVECDMRRP